MTESDSDALKNLRRTPTSEPRFHRQLERLSLADLNLYKQSETRLGALRFIQREINRRRIEHVQKTGRLSEK